jgi:hypothetical protein
MIINPFKKESTRKKLINFLPELESKCINLSDFFKENVDLVEIDDDLSKSLKLKKGTEVLAVKKKNHEKLIELIEDFESNKSIALEWLEGIRPFLLEDGYTKDVYAICDNKIDEILTEYNKVVAFINKYEMYTI